MKESKKTHKTKIVFFLIVFAALIAIQIKTFIPYTITEIYISSQNVPHSVIVGRGWTGIDNVGFTYRDKGNESPDITTKQINIPVTVVQFLLTTAITAFVFFASDFKPGKNKADAEILKKQETQPQSVVDNNSSENKEPISAFNEQLSLFDIISKSEADELTSTEPITEKETRHVEEKKKSPVFDSDHEKLFIYVGIAYISLVLLVFLYGLGDLPLNILIIDASKNFFIYIIVLSALFLYRFFRKKIIRNKVFYITWALFFLLSTPYIPSLCGYETTQIGDLYEAREYTEKYYVTMSRELEGTSNRQIYTLPAEIERRRDHLGSNEIVEDYYFQEHGGDEIYEYNYHINYIYLPNGGYISFDYDRAYEDPSLTDVSLHNEVTVMDYKGCEYYVTLTKEKAK